MKTVVFLSPSDPASAQQAASWFDSFTRPDLARAVPLRLVPDANLIVHLGEDEPALPAGVPHESWNEREADRLRRRVWRLVAREGWYRLQPAAMILEKPSGNRP